MGRWNLGDSIPKVVDQSVMIQILEAHGWLLARGGKHNVKMTKPGERPIPLPQNHGKDYPKQTRDGILKQANISDS